MTIHQTKRDLEALGSFILGLAIILFGVYSCGKFQSGPEANRTAKSWTDLGVSTTNITTSRFDRTVTISPEVSNGKRLDYTASTSRTGETRADVSGFGISTTSLSGNIRFSEQPRNLDLKWNIFTGKLTETNYGFDFRPGINISKTLKDQGAGLDFRFAHAWNFGAQAGIEGFQKSRQIKPSLSLGYNLSYVKLRNTDIVVTYAFKDWLLGLRVEL